MVASLDQAANISLRELSNAPIFSQLRPNCEVKSALKLMPMNFFCVTALMFLTGCAHSLATKSNNLTYAVAWKKTSAEYEALFHQGFNVARQRVETALRVSGTSMPRLAVISDVDDTLLLSTTYWADLISTNKEFFEDRAWDEWVETNDAEASPGAIEFLNFCAENSVEVFYVTNRDQGEQTKNILMTALKKLRFPYVDEEHVFVLRTSSNKEPVRKKITEQYKVVVYLGDNLNDFNRSYYSDDVWSRKDQLTSDIEKFGSHFVLFPNPTDGHWLKAIFGVSEPEPTPENKALIRQVITKPNATTPD